MSLPNAMKIYSDSTKGCIFFEPSTVAPKFIGTMTAEIHPTEADRVVIKRTDKEDANGDPRVVFARMFIDRIQNEQGVDLVADLGYTITQVVDYLNTEFNDYQVVSGVDTDGSEIVNFTKDATREHIVIDNGAIYPLDVIRAVGDATTGTIALQNLLITPDLTYYNNIPKESVTIEGEAQPDDLNTVVNALNEYFSSQPFNLTGSGVTGLVDLTGSQLDDPLTTPAGDNNEYQISVDGNGDWGTTQTQGRYWTSTLLDGAGEYYTFKIKGAGVMSIGAYDSAGDDAATLALNQDITRAAGNLWAMWLHPNNSGPYEINGENSGHVYLEGWSTGAEPFGTETGWATGSEVTMKAGVDQDGFFYTAYWNATENRWIKIARTNYQITDPVGLVLKFEGAGGTLSEAPKVHNIGDHDETPIFYAIESPDGSWYYPLFNSPIDAGIVDHEYGTSVTDPGTSHSHVFIDDPNLATWYMPDTIQYHATSTKFDVVSTDPFSFFNNVQWNIIQTDVDSNHAPDAFTIADLTVDEGAVSVNYQVNPLGGSYSTTVTGLPAGMSYNGLNAITGTAPSVSGDTSTNPSDTYTITVTRTNNYGSTSTTFDFIVNNLTQPTTASTGFTNLYGSTLDNGDGTTTMQADSGVLLNETLSDGHRMVFLATWIETHVLPALQSTGDKVWIGVPRVGYTTPVSNSQFDVYMAWEYNANGHYTAIYERSGSGTLNATTINSSTVAFYDYGIEWDRTNLGVIGCNNNAIMNEVSIALGGQFTRAESWTNYTEQTAPFNVIIGTNCELTIGQTGIQEVIIPRPATYIQVAEPTEGNFTFNGLTPANFTLQAGTTYRFLMGSVEWDDQTTATNIEAADVLKFTADDTTEYTTGITRVGTPGDTGYDTAYVDFVVPSDVPPLKVYQGANVGSGSTIQISGSTYVATITGITKEGPAANQTGTNIMDQYQHGWISIDDQLSAGQRFVMDNSFFSDFLTYAKGTTTIFAIGLKGDNWTNTKEVNNATAAASGEFFKGNTYIVGVWNGSATGVTMQIIANGASGSTMYMNSTGLYPTTCGFLEITSSGNNIRAAFGRNNSIGNISAGDESTVTYANWNAYKGQTGAQGYGISSIDVVMSFWTFSGAAIDGDDIDWTLLNEISIPAPAVTNQTSWSKAVDFSGGSEYVYQTSTSSGASPLAMSQYGVTVAGPSTPGYTTSTTTGRPWATAIVFRHDGNSSNQHIWNFGEGAGSSDDNIYLRQDSNRQLYFGWGRQGAVNECAIGSTVANRWYGIYIGYNGARWSGNNATATNLAATFDIRVTNEAIGWATPTYNYSNQYTWSTNGGRMDRAFQNANMNIGGRGSNRNWHGKVASMVVTTLKINNAMPTDAEILDMITDPVKWLTDYKVGNNYRTPNNSANSTNFQINAYGAGYATQVWLMGDTALDSYSNGIRNYVLSTDQNYTRLGWNSMVSSDIETVNISGLT